MEPTEHVGHEGKAQDELMAEEKFKEISKAAILCKPAQIINKFHGEVEAGTSVPDDAKLRYRINYMRKKVYGAECGLDEMLATGSLKTVSGENFLLYIAEEKDLMMMGTKDNLSRLMKCDEWMSDGTFSIVLKEYHQLYTICGKMYGLWSPLVYVLMKRRTKNDYYKIWMKICQICDEYGIDVVEAPILHVDFENAVSYRSSIIL